MFPALESNRPPTMDTESLASFFGWCTVVHVAIYLLTVVSLFFFRKTAMKINARIFGISEDDVATMTFQYVGNFKLATTVLAFAPYVALRLMS